MLILQNGILPFTLQISEMVGKYVDLSYPLEKIFLKILTFTFAQPKIVTYRVHA